MLDYCPPNVTISQLWLEHGWSPCFLDTFSVSLVSAFLLIFGSAQIYMYRRYATQNADAPTTRLYRLQVALHMLIPPLEIVRFLLLQTSAYDDPSHQPIFGYQILHVCLTLFVYATLLCLLLREHNYLLPATPSRGHGLVLLVSWTLLFIIENLQLINMNSTRWVNLSGMQNRVELALFAVRYTMCLGVFVLGLKAPGCARPLRSEDYDRLAGDGNSVSAGSVYELVVLFYLFNRVH